MLTMRVVFVCFGCEESSCPRPCAGKAVGVLSGPSQWQAKTHSHGRCEGLFQWRAESWVPLPDVQLMPAAIPAAASAAALHVARCFRAAAWE
jgi:hypothetical protein